MNHRKNLNRALIVVLVLGLIFALSQIARTATLFSEDFEDGNYNGWSTSGGSWSIITDGTKVDKQSSLSATALTYTGTSTWSNYSVQARVKPLSFNGTDRVVGLCARVQGATNFYTVILSNANQLEIRKKVGGAFNTLATKSFTVQTNTWYTMKFTLSGTTLEAYVNGNLELTATDAAFSAGKIGITTVNASAEFDDVIVDGSTTPTATPTATAVVSPTNTPTPTVRPTPTPTVIPGTPTPTPTRVPGIVLYVAPNGSDSNAGTTIDQPLFSLSKAAAMVGPGSTIYMRGGTYYYTATVSLAATGTAGQPIQVLAYNGEKPILNYQNWHPATETLRGAARGIKVEQSARYWYLKGLEICYAPDNGVKCEGGHTTFEQCVFHHNGDSGLQIGLNKEDYTVNPDPENLAAYTRVINSDSYRNADPATDYENADGFACKLYAGRGNYFYGCRAWENCDDGWDCYQTEDQIVFEYCWSWHNGDPTLWGFSSFNGDGNGFKLGGDNTYCPMTLTNCVALNCNWGALGGFAYNNNTAPFTMYNLTAINCGRPYKLSQNGNIVKNCIDYNGTRPAPKDISTSTTQVANTWNLGITVTPNDFVSIAEADAAAPRQADGSLPNNGFAKLAANSQLIDKGVNVGLPYLGAAPDLGAYERQ